MRTPYGSSSLVTDAVATVWSGSPLMRSSLRSWTAMCRDQGRHAHGTGVLIGNVGEGWIASLLGPPSAQRGALAVRSGAFDRRSSCERGRPHSMPARRVTPRLG